jgi:hypothetical protein
MDDFESIVIRADTSNCRRTPIRPIELKLLGVCRTSLGVSRRVDFQSVLLRWAQEQSAVTSLVAAAAGLLLALQGFRFARTIIALTSAGAGLLTGAFGAQLGHLEPFLPAAAGASVFGLIGLLRYRVGLGIASSLVFGLLTNYLCYQLGLWPNGSIVPFSSGAVGGFIVCALGRRSLPIILSTLEGGALLIAGFVGLCSAALPSLGATFVSTADRVALMVPTLLLMLFVTGYSIQLNARQGDVRAGGGRGWNDGQ